MIGVLIVNYNNIELTKNCIESLDKQNNKKFEIYLFDQNSDEVGTSEFLTQCEEKKIKVFKNSENVPLNHLWNDFKNICPHRMLCFLNNDVVLSKTFIDDTTNVFNTNSKVGIVIHVTNNPQYLKAEKTLKYAILEPAFYQGWDFTIKRSLMPEIPKELKIFAGDDYIFAKVNSLGYKVAMVFSSPIIHYKERTRKLINNINEIQQSDTAHFYNLLKSENLKQVNHIFDSGLSLKYPTENMKLI